MEIPVRHREPGLAGELVGALAARDQPRAVGAADHVRLFALGVGLASLFFLPFGPFYRRQVIAAGTPLGWIHYCLRNLWFIDRLWTWLALHLVHVGQVACGRFDKRVVDGFVNFWGSVCRFVLAVAGAVDYLLGREEVTSTKVGAIGFCMGGGFVLNLAAQQGEKISAAVPFYGVGQAVPDDYTGVKAAIQGHYAIHDGFYPVEDARAQEEQIRRESGAEVTFYYYDADHAFHNDQNPAGNYKPEYARQAWQRSVEFLKKHAG